MANAPPNLWGPTALPSGGDHRLPPPSGYPSLQSQTGAYPLGGYSVPSALMAPTPQSAAGRLQPLPLSVYGGGNGGAGGGAGYGGQGGLNGGYSGMQGGYQHQGR